MKDKMTQAEIDELFKKFEITMIEEMMHKMGHFDFQWFDASELSDELISAKAKEEQRRKN